MSPRAPPYAAIVLAAVVLGAGCVGAPEPTPASTEAPTTSAKLFVPGTGEGAVGYLNSYIMTHPDRRPSAPESQAKARDSLEALLVEMGHTVVREEYSTPVPGVNIMAIQQGTVTPDEWIVLTAHYDTVPGTKYGAWDDGAGVSLLLEVARSGITRDYNRTIVYLFTDGEEGDNTQPQKRGGLWGSAAFVEAHAPDGVLFANLNFDPPGLNWPCRDPQGYLPVKVIFDEKRTKDGLRGYAELKEIVLASLDEVGVPEEVRDFDPGIPIVVAGGQGLRGTSDHASFNAADVPAVFIGSAPTVRFPTGGVLSYGVHTPLDDVRSMEIRCGGKDLLTQAMGVEVAIAQAALARLDGVTIAEKGSA